jgi:hypothetical protein
MDMLYACPDQAQAELDGMPCMPWTSSGTNRYLSAAPRSRHPGGVQVAFASGRVAFLLDSVDPLVMAYLVAINDGHSVDLDASVQ